MRTMTFGAIALEITPVTNDPQAWAACNKCYDNVALMVEDNGGSAVYGWSFVKVSDSDKSFRVDAAMYATHHAVWRSPDGELIDITPYRNPSGEAKGFNLIMHRSFVVDNRGCENIDDDKWIGFVSRAHCLSKNKKLIARMSALQQKQYEWWRDRRSATLGV
jgi:hypothetical protein